MAEGEEGLKGLLVTVTEESETNGLKLNIQKQAKTMVSGPITSWLIDGEKVNTVTDSVLGSKITADGDCSHNVKRCLLLGKKTLRKVKVKVAQSSLSLCDRMGYTVRGILQASCEKPRPHIKSRDITLLTEAHTVKAEV